MFVFCQPDQSKKVPKVATPENNDPPKAATDVIDILNELSQTD